jgi:hypothetical protein
VHHAGLTTPSPGNNAVTTILAAPPVGSRYRLWAWSAAYDAVGLAYQEDRIQLFAGASPPATGQMYGMLRITSTLQSDAQQGYPGGLVSSAPANSIRARQLSTNLGDAVTVTLWYTVEQA